MNERRTWNTLLEHLSTLPTPVHPEGPWDGRYLAPYTRDTGRVILEPIAPRITDLDYRAYMSSIGHIRRSYGDGHFPTPDITLDEASLDTHECWNEFGRGTAFLYAALTPARDEEVGCVYLTPTGDPREASLQMWVVEEGLKSDLDRHLLEATLAWIEDAWDLDRVVDLVPSAYSRGIEIAEGVGLTRVTRDDQPSGFVCYAWNRSPST